MEEEYESVEDEFVELVEKLLECKVEATGAPHLKKLKELEEREEILNSKILETRKMLRESTKVRRIGSN